MAKRSLTILGATMAFITAGATAAMACGGLIGPRGSVNLLRTTTFAGYHRGVEHYVTSFNYAGGGGGEFGSLVPLPGVPTKVERGGDWTLQRLLREVSPPPAEFALAAEDGAAGRSARVLLETRIDALDITILEGGAAEVARWATEHGFELSPDAPEVLEFYAARSPIFMAARFDAAEAARRGQQIGDGTPIHLTIPTPNPWVPLRILALGKQPVERVEADVFLLTDRAPAMLPVARSASGEGPATSALTLQRSERASASLIEDLRSDKGMGWIPASGMWLSYMTLDGAASEVTFDLAIDASGAGRPSPVAAGLSEQIAAAARDSAASWIALSLGMALLVAAMIALSRRRAPQPG